MKDSETPAPSEKFAHIEEVGWSWAVLLKGSDWAVTREGNPEVAQRIADVLNAAHEKLVGGDKKEGV